MGWKGKLEKSAENFLEPKKRLRDRESTFAFDGVARILAFPGVGCTCLGKF